ncbi:MAG TPA: hypothetical protein VGO96_21300 [Pyrinomonadaceae bacterium]|jgi:hypothetical protein|nr:hypothetical protein [Pyrinomonadaceae bacterium]
MDDANLIDLLRDNGKRQFWLKPWGSRNYSDDLSAQPRTQFFAQPELEIAFAKSKNPPPIQEGDVFIVYHIKMPHMAGGRLVCMTESLSSPNYATVEQVEPWRKDYPWSIDAKNLTPTYGSKWFNYSLDPFRLVEEYTMQNPSHNVTRAGHTLGAINFGATKLWIQEGFAKFLINQIIQLK